MNTLTLSLKAYLGQKSIFIQIQGFYLSLNITYQIINTKNLFFIENISI